MYRCARHLMLLERQALQIQSRRGNETGTMDYRPAFCSQRLRQAYSPQSASFQLPSRCEDDTLFECRQRAAQFELSENPGAHRVVDLKDYMTKEK